jgi:hypothetical protein
VNFEDYEDFDGFDGFESYVGFAGYDVRRSRRPKIQQPPRDDDGAVPCCVSAPLRSKAATIWLWVLSCSNLKILNRKYINNNLRIRMAAVKIS